MSATVTTAICNTTTGQLPAGATQSEATAGAEDQDQPTTRAMDL